MTNALRLKLLRLLGHQDWIRWGVRDRIIRRFCNPDTVDSQDFDVDFFNLKYNGNLSCYVDWVVYFYGAYEKYELLLLRDILLDKVKPVSLDVGANVGHHSLFMSQFCDVVHAFEPYEPVRNQLESKIRYNGISNIVVHSVGLADKDCELDFFAPKGTNTGTGSFVPQHAEYNNELFDKLRVVNGDNYVSKLKLQKIDLIKIDVEGFEKNVIMGLRDTLIKHRPVVFMEFSTETKSSFDGVDEMMSLLPPNYQVKRIQAFQPHLMFFNKPGYSYEEFNFKVFGNLVCFPDDKHKLNGEQS